MWIRVLGPRYLRPDYDYGNGKISPVAAIKITQHNLYRPTAIVHETGHQVAHILKWTEELEQAVNQELQEFGIGSYYGIRRMGK